MPTTGLTASRLCTMAISDIDLSCQPVAVNIRSARIELDGDTANLTDRSRNTDQTETITGCFQAATLADPPQPRTCSNASNASA
jgi:hypothetical protein